MLTRNEFLIIAKMKKIIISIFVIKALKSMKHLKGFILFICFFISLTVQAQQNHFIYIQADNKQPFYVKLDKKIFSSSASGYLILARLKTGSYDLVVGFPQNEWPEQSIPCKIEDTDLGYLLKNFGDKGWGFFNIQSLNVLMATGKKANKITDTLVQVNGDAFSNMLSEVVNDPTIKQKEIAKEDPKKLAVQEVKVSVAETPPATLQAREQAKIDEPVSSNSKTAEPLKEEPVNLVAEKNEDKKNIYGKPKAIPVVDSDLVKEKPSAPPNPALPENRNTIVKKLNSNTSLGIEGIYIDSADGHTDTISVFIAAEKATPDTLAVKKNSTEKPNADTANTTLSKGKVLENSETKSDSKPITPATAEQNRQVAEIKAEKPVEQPRTVPVAIINSDCKALASEDDFLKLRKKMAAANNEEMMINIAKKMFKSKCFTTEQVKNLGTLFLKDEKRYGFFDAAYPFVSDSQNFPILESQLTDGYYINRFKVMIRH